MIGSHRLRDRSAQQIARREQDRMMQSLSSQSFELPDGRCLAFDDVGAVDGAAVVYLHGTPDSRLSRHPDDSIAATLGARLIAVDRPGYGDSTFDPSGTVLSCGEDVARLADHLGLERYATFGWSGGGAFALAAAVRDPGRVGAVAVACSLAPIDAIDTPEVFDGANEQMQLFVEVTRQMSVEELPKIVAPLLWPDVASLAEARDNILAGADEAVRADFDAVPGALDQLARGALHGLRHGRAGLERDIALLVSPLGFALEEVLVRVHLWYGAADGTATIGAGRFYAQRIPHAELTEIAGGSHFLVISHWSDIIGDLARALR